MDNLIKRRLIDLDPDTAEAALDKMEDFERRARQEIEYEAGRLERDKGGGLNEQGPKS